jgi:hypothetical protein
VRSSLLIAIVSIVLLAVACVPAAASTPSAKKSCKGTKVAVKIGNRSSCQPFAKVFPKPQAVDLRLAYLQRALKYDPAKALKGRKRKRARTLQSGFGAAGKQAQRKVLRLLPKALAFFDRNRGGASSSAANCGVGAAGERGTLGGSSTVVLLGNNGMQIETDAGHGLRIRVTFFSCGGVTSFRVPECPTAAGDVEAPAASGDFSATTEVFEGNTLKSRNSTRFEDESKARGKVGPDAKLKYVDVEHKQTVLIVVPGSVFRSSVLRKVRVEMPGGDFDPDNASVLYSGDWLGANLGAEGFARSAKAAIDSYKQAEPRWSSFDRKPYCAQAVFSPATDTIKVKREEKKQLSIYARAQADGGRATGARWELLGPSNAEFAPTASQDPSPTVQYTVTKTPQGDQVKVTARFTSTAGVGEDSWKQPIEGGLPERFAMTFSGSASYDSSEVGTGGGQASWSGNAELLEIPSPYPPGTFPYSFAMYKLASGSVTYSYSGAFGSECSATASGSIDLALQPDLVGGAVLSIFDKAPREYSIFLGMPLTKEAEVPGSLGPCEDPEDEKPIDFSPGIGVPLLVNAPLPGGPVDDGWAFSGQGSGHPPGSPDQTWHWNASPISGP